MQSINDRAGQDLQWMQPHAMRREYELRAGEQQLGELRFQKSTGTLATAQIGEEAWTFKRSGFWHPLITARAVGSEEDLARFEPGWRGGGTLRLAQRAYTWKGSGFWHAEMAWLAASGAQVVAFTRAQGLMKIHADVHLAPDTRALPELGLLVALGWYLLIMGASDSASTSAATVATM